MQNVAENSLNILKEREDTLRNSLKYLEYRIDGFLFERDYSHTLAKYNRRAVMMKYGNKLTRALQISVTISILAGFMSLSRENIMTGADYLNIAFLPPVAYGTLLYPKAKKEYREAGCLHTLNETLSRELPLDYCGILQKWTSELLEELKVLKENPSEDDIREFEMKSKNYTSENFNTIITLISNHSLSNSKYYNKYVDGTLEEDLLNEGYSEFIVKLFCDYIECYHGPRENQKRASL